MYDVSQFDIDTAVRNAARDAERNVNDLRDDLERRINDLENTVHNLRRQACSCQNNDSCP